MTQNQNLTQNLKEHHASVTVNAPVNQVYNLFTHFNDFPKFMSFVSEVTYYDEQHSHWVANVVGRHEWDAVNEGWVENRQIGWRSYNGLENTGRITFQTTGPMMTQVDAFVAYNPPAGVLGDVGEGLGAGSTFESKLQHDLDNFARMVHEAPQGALDPTSSNYLFHGDSAAAKGTTTDRQNATMQETVTTSGRELNRPITDADIINDPSITGISTPINDQPLGRRDQGTYYDPTRPSSEDTANRGSLGRPDQGTSYDPTRASESPDGRLNS
jgi:uncharacterized membrane protein